MANKVYTDQQMQWGAQIGYYNFNSDDFARQRLVLDVMDIRKNFGTKYNKGLLEMIRYAKTLPEFQ